MKSLDKLNLPTDLKYDDDHEWITGSAPFRVGISDYAQDQLGDLTFVELPEIGTALGKGDEFGTLESTKSVSPLLLPVGGKIVAVNEALNDDPGLVNREPYENGWIVEIQPENIEELKTLKDVDAYRAFLEANAG